MSQEREHRRSCENVDATETHFVCSIARHFVSIGWQVERSKDSIRILYIYIFVYISICVGPSVCQQKPRKETIRLEGMEFTPRYNMQIISFPSWLLPSPLYILFLLPASSLEVPIPRKCLGCEALASLRRAKKDY